MVINVLLLCRSCDKQHFQCNLQFLLLNSKGKEVYIFSSFFFQRWNNASQSSAPEKVLHSVCQVIKCLCILVFKFLKQIRKKSHSFITKYSGECLAGVRGLPLRALRKEQLAEYLFTSHSWWRLFFFATEKFKTTFVLDNTRFILQLGYFWQ